MPAGLQQVWSQQPAVGAFFLPNAALGSVQSCLSHLHREDNRLFHLLDFCTGPCGFDSSLRVLTAAAPGAPEGCLLSSLALETTHTAHRDPGIGRQPAGCGLIVRGRPAILHRAFHLLNVFKAPFYSIIPFDPSCNPGKQAGQLCCFSLPS